MILYTAPISNTNYVHILSVCAHYVHPVCHMFSAIYIYVWRWVSEYLLCISVCFSPVAKSVACLPDDNSDILCISLRKRKRLTLCLGWGYLSLQPIGAEQRWKMSFPLRMRPSCENAGAPAGSGAVGSASHHLSMGRENSCLYGYPHSCLQTQPTSISLREIPTNEQQTTKSQPMTVG